MIALTTVSRFIILFVLSVAIVIPFFKSPFLNDSVKLESSVWCLKISKNDRLCTFKNLCYSTNFKTFLFFIGNGTVMRGVSHYSDLQKIQLSSLSSHNQFFLNLSVVSNESFKISKIVVIEDKALLFSRFKSDNIMHVIHDDLLPMFLTLETVCLGDKNCMESYSLILHDNYAQGPFFNLYKIFSKNFPVILNKLPSNSNLLCFKEILTGLVQDSIFYQYGFKRPHGPVRSPYLMQDDILRFTSFVKNKLKLKVENSEANVVLINRQKSRRILNIESVKDMIADVYQKIYKSDVKILLLDLHTNKTIAFLKAVSQAHVLIGMHGAEMIFSLFMKPDSVVIELFPYGIRPEVVSFVKPLSELKDSHINYFSWKNSYKNLSVAHPNSHPLLGGISHLDEITQEKIRNTHEVPPVECCNEPVYLYHMYQDTWVSSEFKEFLYESFSKDLNQKKQLDISHKTNKWFYPHTVSNVSCKFDSNERLLNITWEPPFNVKKLNDIKYNLYVKDEKHKFSREFVTEGLGLRLKIPVEVGIRPRFQLWISVHYTVSGSKSPDVYLECL